ncbi:MULTISPECIES: cell division protein FtsL [Exiguobacterium]|uniref:Cell division protein FtsL n=1 Tax=Exiguobacterium acetylicum TaxID=41170 RepID=A0ABX8G7S8_EXIAC|nr:MULTISPECIES: cell division protein FtsL [Exiguobacterium]AOT01165.1 cell division protein FtsL [Exiguobacterium sp. U13-1]OAI89344.1 cell division protein FtsL [Exiguobacterium sp. KKBO11]QWB29117.1 cell division protein FtsL [Exiguobacterium acetylicum]HBQ75758.1 cell division protein FtsL [Exiguobacterium sp.]HCD59743.1 cell division protein FtsL [Exiguobacterium sp.]
MAEPLRKSVQTVQPVRQQPVQEPRKTEDIARRVAVRPKYRLYPFEKFLYSAMIGGLVLFGSLTISTHNEAYNVSRDLAKENQVTQSLQKENERLQLEVTNLSSPERIYKIAKEQGLDMRKGNIKVIPK